MRLITGKRFLTAALILWIIWCFRAWICIRLLTAFIDLEGKFLPLVLHHRILIEGKTHENRSDNYSVVKLASFFTNFRH
jgi:hypothetical protein